MKDHDFAVPSKTGNNSSMPNSPHGENEGEFFKLIPKGMGFEQEKISHNTPELEFFKTETEPRARLLKAFGYQNKRQSDIELALYLKPIFILNNGLPKQSAPAREALKLLAAEQDVLFKDGDSIYRSRYQNADLLSEQRRIERQSYSPEMKENLVRQTMALHSGNKTALNQKLVKMLLSAIAEAAADKRSTVYDWLYSAKHIGITDYNRADYIEKCRVGLDGYYNAGRTLPENIRAWDEFNRSIRNNKNPWDIWRLDLSKCAEDFKALLPEEDKASITIEFCEEFIGKYLAEYIHLQQLLKGRYPESRYYYDETRVHGNFHEFEKRYIQLSALEEKFSVSTHVIPNKCPDLVDWGGMNDVKETPLSNAVTQAIKEFFLNIGMPLRDLPESYLLNRICWVLYSPKLRPYSQNEKPLLFLAMALACRKKIVLMDTCKFDFNRMFPCRFSQISKAKQRYAEITLLHQLHHVFKLHWEEQAKSWNEYFSCQGKEIYSIEEAAFWRKLIDNEYEKLPAVGFQLCFLDYCEQCLPPHYEKLSYQALSDAHLGGYHQFFQENNEHIQELASSIGKRNHYIREYIACWKAPKSTNDDRRVILKRMCLDFSECAIIKECPDDELKCLVIETAIQMQIRDQARRKLYKWFQMEYGCSLNGALERHVS